MTYFNNLKDIAPTQVLAKGILLNDLFKEDLLKELNSKFGEKFLDIRIADIRITLTQKKQKEMKPKKDDAGMYLTFIVPDFIRFEQPTPDHLKEKVVIITSNRKGNIDLLLQK